MKSSSTDVVVIGAGPGGYVAALKAAKLGPKTVLIDKDYIGGVCLNCGCIPSKALINAANTYHGINKAKRMGILVNEAWLDMAKMRKWKDSVVKRLTTGISQLLKERDVKIMIGEARFQSPREIIVTTDTGAEKINATHVIIATGSVPIEVPGFAFDGEKVLNSSHVLDLEVTPKRLLIVGGGYIGLELGTVMAKFGSKVTVVEMMEQVLPGFDQDIVQVINRNLRRLRVDVKLNTKAFEYTEVDDGLSVKLSGKDGESEIIVDKIFVSVGRRPNTKSLNLLEMDIRLNEQGFIMTDDSLQTYMPGVYAIGDVIGQPMLAHKASYEGEVVAEIIAGKLEKKRERIVPAVIFTDPEVAVAGISVAEAKKLGIEVITGEFAFAGSGRAVTYNETDGFVRFIAARDDNRILGVQMVGIEVSNLVSEAVVAMENGVKANELADCIHPHPTLSEPLMEAAKDIFGNAVHK